ncbi:acyltransferase family protein [Flavobacterium rhizosphaerae]|uniref:Acyltransferase n=1 Tax=Flavobacterium rhizosphaerae TaxID=3163298 RepID=A0ABW8YYC9_9FLAO
MNQAVKGTALPTKPHYAILDGLRGIAALMVVAFHIFEAHATSHQDQIINHGYLAVDFFFMLSGFVIGYAYDDRWGKMNIAGFFRRRLVRLQPMVVFGMVVGAVLFYLQASPWMPKVAETPVWKLIIVTLIGCTLWPLTPSQEIRGWGEMHPLNGPGWSLFYEYIANIFYALFGRRLSKAALAVLVCLSAVALVYVAVFGKNGDVVGGWELSASGLQIGFSRMMFPFFGGLLLFRVVKIKSVHRAFLWCSLLLVIILALPRLGTEKTLYINGLYESACIILLFPLIVYMGAGGGMPGGLQGRLCRFLGDISYPLYITHYPLIYIYWAYVERNTVDGNRPSLNDAWPYMVLVFAGSLVLAYAALKLYDEPVRRFLKRKKRQ